MQHPHQTTVPRSHSLSSRFVLRRRGSDATSPIRPGLPQNVRQPSVDAEREDLTTNGRTAPPANYGLRQAVLKNPMHSMTFRHSVGAKRASPDYNDYSAILGRALRYRAFLPRRARGYAACLPRVAEKD